VGASPYIVYVIMRERNIYRRRNSRERRAVMIFFRPIKKLKRGRVNRIRGIVFSVKKDAGAPLDSKSKTLYMLIFYSAIYIKKYNIVIVCPAASKGCSTGFAPIYIRIRKIAVVHQNAIFW